MALVWLFVVMTVFTVIYLLMDYMEVGPIERIPAYVLLSTVMLVICVWQAARVRPGGGSIPQADLSTLGGALQSGVNFAHFAHDGVIAAGVSQSPR